MLGWVLYKRGDYQGALPLFEECVKRVPESAQYHYHLGMALLAAGNKGSAHTQLEAAVHTNQLRPAEQEQARSALARAN